MAKDEEEDDLLPDKDAAKGFYAKYEPKEILGRGISSTVRRCIEKETGKEFAAKIIDLGAATEAGETNPYHMLEATRQEISILRQVMGHPYIIDLQDVFESDAFVFLVFELCPKGELFDYLTSVVTLSEKKTRTIMRQIFEGVEYIHAKNIVHRDLKPENILLDENHNVKITDFGFARQLKDTEKLSDLCGTPGYLAPETLKCNMFEGSPGYSKEVDIWACGVIMFTLLVGCPPFWHRKQMVMLRNIMEGKYSFTSPEWADISEDPKDLIRKCLVVDPAKRITVKEVLKHPFFNQMVLCAAEPSIDGRATYQLKSQNLRNLNSASQNYHYQTNANANANISANNANVVNTNLYLSHNKQQQQPKHEQHSQQQQLQQQQQQLPPPQAANSTSTMQYNHFNNYNNTNNNSYHNNFNNNNNYGNNTTNINNINSMNAHISTAGSAGASNNYKRYLKHSIANNIESGYTDARHITQLAPFTLQQQQRLQQQHQQHQQQHQQQYQQTNEQQQYSHSHPHPEQQLQRQQEQLQQFYVEQLRKQSRFNARKKFQFAILVVRAMIRIRRLRYTAEPLCVEEAIRDPYRVKVLRKVIDGCAFRVYGHWVKKGEGQNRAALFENTPRTELHALYINNLSR